MSTAASTTLDAYERCIGPVLNQLTNRQIKAFIDYRGSAAVQKRMKSLFRKSNEGELTPSERDEYDGYVRANTYLATLQAKARRAARRKAE
jgi:hypothetical protein